MREKQTHTFFLKKNNKKTTKKGKKQFFMSFWQSTDFNTFKDFANSCLVPPPNLFTFLLFYVQAARLAQKKGAQ